jgi:hypothetical protein
MMSSLAYGRFQMDVHNTVNQKKALLITLLLLNLV